MNALSPALIKIVLAVGGLLLVAILTVIAILSGRGPSEQDLLSDATAGQPTLVQVGKGTATVWVAGTGSDDPRPGGEPDPGLCSVTGEGMPSLTQPDTTDTTTIGETTLYPLAQVEDYTPPTRITCSGGSIDHVYVMR